MASLTDHQKLFADKYLLTNRCLGEGAEAAVYLAIDVITKKQLVCKLVNLDKQHSRSAGDVRRRTFQETDILRQLQHVSAVQSMVKGKKADI